MIKAAATSTGLFDVELPQAPYPGLRPFESHEWPVFFGRETMISEAISRLLDQNFLVVHGDSGCGKSSLMRAGVLVQLKQRHARGAQRWRTGTMLPREAPLWALAQVLASFKELEPSPDLVRSVRRILNAGRTAAAKLEEFLCTDATDRICILVDQFEELFRVTTENSASEARLFVEVLVGLIEQAEQRKSENDRLRIYVVLTMRSEFLGACARFAGFAQAVNKTQYLLPRMERPALLRAIREPARLFGGEVSRELTDRLIGAGGAGQDQLPLIQHGLLLLWQRKVAEGASNIMERQRLDGAGSQSEPIWRLDIRDFQNTGGLVNLLSTHADAVMDLAATDLNRKRTVEFLFRALTDINSDGHAIRRPQTFGQLTAATGAEESTLREIIDRFRAEGASYLTPYGEQPIFLNTQIDISHEALIRCWHKIADSKEGWQRKEFQDGLIWKSLRMQADNDETLSAEATRTRGEWLKTLPSDTWCMRYGGGWQKIQNLMNRSCEARDKAARKEKWFRAGLVATVSLLVLAIIAGSFWLQAENSAAQAELGQQRALSGQSRFLTQLANQQNESSNHTVALLLALEALPTSVANSQRPLEAAVLPELYRAMLNLRERVVLSGHQDGVVHASFSTDNKHVVTASWDKTARLWNAENGSLEAELSGHREGVVHANFNADDTQIVTASHDNTARLWNTEDGSLVAELTGHQGPVVHASFSTDGKQVVTASWDDTARLWNTEDGSLVAELSGHKDDVVHATFSADNNQVVTASRDETARLWNAENGSLVAELSGHQGDVDHATFSADGRLVVTASRDNTARLWDSENGLPLGVLYGHLGPVSHASFSADGQRVVTASRDNTARLWNVVDGSLIAELSGHQGPVVRASFSIDNLHVVTASWDDTARLWNAVDGSLVAELSGHQSDVDHATFSADGKQIVTASWDNTARLWNAKHGSLMTELNGHQGSVNNATFSADGKQVVTASLDNTALLWNAESGNLVAELNGHQGSVNNATFSADGKQVVTASWDNTARLWSAEDGNLVAELSGHQRSVNDAIFSTDGKQVVTASLDETARLWNAVDGELVAELIGHQDDVVHANFSADDLQVVTASHDNTARLWSAVDGSLVTELIGHQDDVVHASFSGDGKLVVTASHDNTARLWNAVDGSLVTVLRGHQDDVVHASFSADGKQVVTASRDDTARLWNAEDGSLVAELTGHQDDVDHATFSANSKQVVTSSRDETVRLWNAEDGNLVAELIGHKGPVNHASFSMDNQLVVTASRDNTARLWRNFSDVQNLIDAARSLRPVVSHAYVGGLELPSTSVESRKLSPSERENSFLPLRGPDLLARVEKFANQGQIKQAIETYEEATEVNPEVVVSVGLLVTLCQRGATSGHAKEVMTFCDQAVRRNPEHGATYDWRGIARALSEDFDGAIEDFRKSVGWLKQGGQNREGEFRREAWISSLANGKNPFIGETLARRQLESTQLQKEFTLETRKQEVEYLQKLAQLQAQVSSANSSVRQQSNARDQIDVAEIISSTGPAIEIIEPSVFVTRGGPTLRVPSHLINDIDIIGRVYPVSDFISLHVNDKAVDVNQNGVFKANVPVLQNTDTTVRMVALNKTGDRTSMDFLIESSSADLVLSSSTAESDDFGNYHALVIGNAEYQHLPSQPTSRSDAMAVTEVLRTKYGFKTLELYDADRYGMLHALNQLRNTLNKNDNLLIYFSGDSEIDESSRCYWLPVDAETDDRSSWISFISIAAMVDSMSAKHVFVVADSCNSGTLTSYSPPRLSIETDEMRFKYYQSMAKSKVRMMLASGDFQPLSDASGGEHSTFANAFLDVLKENNQILDGYTLYRAVQKHVKTADAAHERVQDPQYGPIRFAGHEAGEFIFKPSVSNQ